MADPAPDQKPEGFFGSSGCLRTVAANAYARIKPDVPETEAYQSDALISILFSAAALEAFVMELQRFAAVGATLKGVAPFMQQLSDVLDEAERSRGSVQLKFLLAKRLLPGKPFDKGALPYQDFDLLFQLRNAIVHLKPQDFSTEPHKLVTALANRELCEQGQPNLQQTWIGLIQTRAVARWACNVPAAIVEALGEGLAPQSLEAAMLTLHSLPFNRVD